MEYLLGVDNGGTTIKAAIFNTKGKEIAVASRLVSPIAPAQGFRERDMMQLWQENINCIREAIKKSRIDTSKIVGIGCTGHGKGLYLWGKDDKPAYNGISSTDLRANNIVRQWKEDGTINRAREKTLQQVSACQPVAILRWMKINRPNIYKNIRWVFEAKDYIRFMLTGRAMAELSDYSGASLINLLSKGYDSELLKIFGLEEISDCLPPLCQSFELCGTVSTEVEKLTGLPVGTPVCGGMFDIDACAVSMDVLSPDKLCMITGTWSINEYPSYTPIAAGSNTRNSLFCVPGMYLIEESSPTSAGNLEWYIRNCLHKDHKKDGWKNELVYKQINELVSSVRPKDGDILFLPFLYGTYTERDCRAAFLGLSNEHTSSHMLCAVFEGVAFSHMYHLRRLLQYRKAPQAVRLAGGAVNSAVWVQMFADIIGIPMEIVLTKELGAKGCAIAAAVAVGIYSDCTEAAREMVSVAETIEPQKENEGIYREKYWRYQRGVELMEELICSNS